MKSPVGSILAACLLWLCSFPGTAADVVFNEIHYHPTQPPVGPEPVSEEFIELYNRGTNTVQLAGWRIAGGVDYTFPQVTIPAGGFLVVVASRTNFETNYVGAGPVVGDWTGKLGNNWQNLELIDSTGETVDQVAYATQGDWAARVRGPSLSGTRGWDWLTSADGFGNTLELINPSLPNTHGQNWGPSLFPKGTPGTANSALNTNSAPMLLDVRHTPAIPKPEETVYVRARLLAAQAPGTRVTLHYRNASSTAPGDYQSTELRDNGSNLDGIANDGIYGGPIPGQTNGAIIEFYVAATNSAGLGRTWPPPAMEDGVPVQAANAQYQVDGTPVNSTQPIYRIIMTAAERQRLQTINRASDAQMNATFISTDDAGTEIRYRCGVRIRGAGSRFRDPPNYRVDFPNDQRWKGMAEINLNTQYGYLQVAGNILAQKAGLIAADARAVQVRINGVNLASTANTSPQMGSYAALEPLDGEWAGRHLPLDANGNMYRASVGSHGATLNKLTSREQAISIGYTKASNGSEDDWSDLIALTTVLADTPTDLYTTEVRKVINVEQWMRYFAFMTLATSMETSYATGRGDDFSLYRGLTDPRFQILVHDLDTIFSLGDTRSDAAVSIWRMVPTLNRNANTAPMDRFMLNNEFASLYFRTLMELIDTAFSPQEFDPLIDQSLGSWVNPDYVSLIKSFQVQRNQGVLAQIPRQLLLSQAGFSSSNGLMVAESAITSLGGAASGEDTHQVLVNGQPAQNWTAYTGRWQITNFALNPGVNQVLVQSIDAEGREIGRLTASIWLNSSLGQQFGGTLPGNTVWSAAEGPYHITNTLTVPVGRTLAIEGGASVFISPGASIAVNGSIQVLGTAVSRIRLSPPPGVSSPWNGIQILNSAQSNRIVFADFIGSDGGADHVRVSNSRIHVEACTWSSGGSRTLIELNNSSATITGCVFPDIIGAEHIHGGPVPSDGWVVIQNNTFGKTTLLNDIIDFTGARRPGPVLIVRGNIFTGASDDVLDLDGTDAWVEGNLFMHVHKDNPNVGDTASAISFGSDSGYAPHVVAVRNYFYEVDHVALCKEGGSISLLNNTAVRVSIAGVNFSEPERNTRPGASAHLEGNIFWNPAGQPGTNFQNRLPTNGVVTITATNNLLFLADLTGIGSGNFSADPLFTNPATNAVTAANHRLTLGLMPGSPALGRGPNGIDLGAGIRAGASISGEPRTPTPSQTAQLTVGGPGIVAYRSRLNTGSWGPEVPTTTAISLNGLPAGAHQVQVIGKTLDGEWQPESSPTTSQLWEVVPQLSGVVLHEILARNDNAVSVAGEFPDMIELYNQGLSSISLAGYGLSDDPEEPFKFRFPAGTTILPQSYRVIYAGGGEATASNTGFGLSQSGATLSLYRPDGSLADQVAFGLQIADFSIGRDRTGTWGLCKPTPAAANHLLSTGPAQFLRINEWLANPQFAFSDDFIELYNPLSVPAALGGLHLSDVPVGDPGKHRIADLSFIGAAGHVLFRADGNVQSGADHVGFKLSSDQGFIGLADDELRMIDCVAYGPQPVDRSEGRQPSGANRFGMFIEPTGGAPNPGIKPAPEILVERTELVPLQARWRYDQSGENRMTQWSAPEYDDSGWPEGDALFGFDNNATYPIPFTTRLTSVNGRFTFYFRTRFQFSGSTEGLQLITTNLLDDGAAYYINGQLAGSRRMPEVFDFRTPSLGGHPGEGTLEVFNLKPDALVQGENVLAAEFHQNAANSGDIAFAMSLSAVRSRTNAAPGALVLSEVFAANRTYTNALGRSPDWVELFNPSVTEIDLSGMSLTDDPQQPARWVFPAGSRIEASSPLRVLLDPDAPPSTAPSPELNAGFGLDEKGDRILLYASPAKGGTLIDGVTFGFQVSDYSIGRIPEDSGIWTLTLPSLAASAPSRPAVLGDPRQLRVNEWMANPRSGDDWFEIYNPSAQPIAMGGLTLTDDLASPAKSIIPPLSFIGSATNGFVEFRADNDSSKGADHVNFRLNNNGESVGIYLPGGVPIDWVTFGPQASGVSQGKFPDGATNIVSFPNTSSPGEMNYLLLHSIAINEILAHTDPPLEDAIELQNIGLGPVDISGWFLSDSIGSPKKYRIPDGTPLAPGSFAVLYENQFNELLGSRNSFSLSSANGDQVYLSAADPGGNLTGYRAVARFGPSRNGVPFGKLETSMGLDYPSLLFRSLGQDNPISLDAFRQGRGLSNPPPIIGPIVISEIHYHPPNIGTNDNTRDEFIELLNTSNQAVQLFDARFPTNTWRLRDAVDFEFPQGFRIDPGSFVVIAGFDPGTNAAQVATFRNDFGIAVGTQILGPLRGKLDNSRDTVELLAPDEPQGAASPDAGKVPYVVVERIRYLDTAPWPTQADAGAPGIGASLQRRAVMGYGNEPTNWLAATPTPGRATGPALTTPPSITTHPRSVTAPEGIAISLSVTAAGPGPLRYQWRFDFEDILDATNSSYSIPLLMTSHVGRYSVRVSNPGGSVLSLPALVQTGGIPFITDHPAHQFSEPDGSVLFRVVALGSPPLRYQWYRNNTAIPSATNNTLLIGSAKPSDQGSYTVEVANQFGTTLSDAASLELGSRPVFVNQPPSLLIREGTSAFFNAGVSGPQPITYQWTFNGSLIPGANSPSFAVLNARLNQAGLYALVASNRFGVTTSTPAQLSIIANPTVTLTTKTPAVSEGGPGSAVIEIHRSYATNEALIVRYKTAGTARNGTDYAPLAGTLVIPANQSVAELLITPLDDGWLEGSEDVEISLDLGEGYTIGIPNVAGASILDNDSLPSSGGTNTITAIGFTNQWRFQQTQNLNSAPWTTIDYNDSTWAQGTGAFYEENDFIPVPKSTRLTLGRTTYYFRTRLQLPSTNGVRLMARYVIDDGAVVHINGQEAYRLGLDAATQVVYNTRANRNVNNAIQEGPFQLPATNLVAGVNVIAVEVHQFDPTSSDVVFALALDVLSPGGVRPVMSEPQVTPSGDIVLIINGEPGKTYHIETSRNLMNWTLLQSLTVPAGGSVQAIDTDSRTGSARFYRAVEQ